MPVGLALEAADLIRVEVRVGQDLDQEVVRHPDARPEVVVRVGFAQDRHPPAQPDIVGAVPAERGIGIPALRNEGSLDVAVVEGRRAVFVLQRLAQRGEHLVPHEVRRTRGPVGLERRRIGQMVAVQRAVGGVEVHHQRRIPGIVDTGE